MYLEIPIEISTFVEYDESSPTGLRSIKTGKVIGARSYTKFGNPKSIHFKFNGKLYKNHRVVWFLHFGQIQEGLQIDHLDGNPFNNCVSNLKCKTQADNLRNQRKGAKNTSGNLGIVLYRYNGVVTAFISKWKDENGVNRGKSFSIKKYGDKALDMALAHRKEQLLRLKSLGFNYTDRHIGG